MVLHPFEEVEISIVRILEQRMMSVAWVLVVESGEEVGQLGHDDSGLASGAVLASFELEE